MKKRIIILLQMLLISCISITAVASNDSTEYSLLQSLGVFDVAPSDMQREVTRGELADIIARFLSKDGVVSFDETELSFTDVTAEHEYYDGICTLYNLNLIDHAEVFRPDDVAKTAEGVKILVDALGYKNIAISSGGYAEAYLNIGAQAGLVNKIENSLLTIGDVYQLLSNASNAQTVRYNGTGFEFTPNETLISKYRGVRRIRAKITANYLADFELFGGESSLGENQIKAGGYVFYDPSSYAVDLLGIECYVYYDAETMDVKFAEPVRKVNYLKITAAEIQEAHDYQLVYTPQSQFDAEKANLDSSAVKVLINGEYTPLYDKTAFEITDGYIELYDNESDGDFDVVYVWNPQVYVVDSVTPERIIFKNGATYDGKQYIVPDENVMMYIDGNKAIISDFVQWDILNIYYMPSIKKTKIECIFNRVSGTLSGYSGDDVVIDGTVYDVHPNSLFDRSNFELGKSVDAYLDISGRVYAMASISTGVDGYITGYITKILFDPNEDTTNANLKIFNELEEWKVYTTAEKVRVYNANYKTGKLTKTPAELKQELTSTGDDVDSVCQIVKFTVNDDGLINNIYCAIPAEEFAGTQTKYPLIIEYDKNSTNSTTEQRYSYAGVLNHAFICSSAFDYWMIPANKDDVDLYNLKDAATVGIDTNGHIFASIKLYNQNGYGKPEFGILAASDSDVGDILVGTEDVGVVTDISTVIYDDMPSKKISIKTLGAVKDFYIPEAYYNSFNGEAGFYPGITFDDITAGDMVQYEYNSKNEIVLIRVLMRLQDAGTHQLTYVNANPGESINPANFSTPYHFLYGTVTRAYGGSKFDININGTVIPYLLRWKGNFLNNYSIVNYSGSKATIEPATVQDVSVGDEVAFVWDYEGVQDMFIYREQ